MEIIKKEILQALARGYCSERNGSKILDSELIEDMAEEIMKVFYSAPKSQLWDGECECGHRHSWHGKSTSINYSAGRCSKCECKNFLHDDNDREKVDSVNFKTGKITRADEK